MMKIFGSVLRMAALAALVELGTAGAGHVSAQDFPRDPYVPPAKRLPSHERPAAGEALRQQALAKLKQRFEQADLDASGALTEEEARKAGLGFVANHFAQIDTARSGKVSFDDLRRYMAQRRKEAMSQPQQ
ncbi:EF-hand domain-containing protein [Pseudoduganella sp. LjRoot289]|uniref:EF-hand domain-containing protein n=1 Tax=Pseudoduganella sp. LjRoot289 TaxID=3342314 RepID=UPI003ECF9705